MRVYHFIDQKHGLLDLENRRLKVARINELNDPFEMLGADLTDTELRRILQASKKQASEWSGFLCFSADWTSPAQWAHYAERHQGFCFGFDVADEDLKKIRYSDSRPKIATDKFLNPEGFSAHAKDQLYYTKAKCWRYEDERRVIVSFEKCEHENGLYFVPFSDDLALREVYVGAASTLPLDRLKEAMNGLDSKIIKVRPAFGTFTLTPDRRWPPEWHAPYEAYSVLEK